MTLIDRFKRLSDMVLDNAVKADFLFTSIEGLYDKLDDARDYYDTIEKVRVFMQNVAEEVQQEVSETICMITTSALYAVFPDPYECKMRFQVKNNLVKAQVFFERAGEEYDPIEDSGGGVIDVAAFAIRVAFIFLSNRSRTIIVDEPFKNVAKAFLPKIPEMIRMLSDKLEVQFIIVSHIPEIIDAADNRINIVMGEIEE